MPAPITSTLTGDIIPLNDADLLVWLVAFNATYDPLEVGIVTPLASTVSTRFVNYQSALNAASNPTTRTTFAITFKNATKALIVDSIRAIYGQLAARNLAGFADCSDTVLNSLGFHAPDKTRTQAPIPAYAPLISFVSSGQAQSVSRITQIDQVTGLARSTRYFARNLAGAEIQVKLAADTAWTSLGVVRRAIVRIDTSLYANGALLSVRCRYANRRGESSPWSDVVSGAVVNG